MQDELDRPFGDEGNEAGKLQSFRWNRLQEDDHLLHCFANDSQLASAVGLFVQETLAGGNAGLIVATHAHLFQIERFLTSKGMDTEKLQRAGRYIPLDAELALERICLGGRVNSRRFFEWIGHIISNASNSWGRVRVFGELVSLLWLQGRREEALELEGFWNDLAKVYSFVLFCGYPPGQHETECPCFAQVCEAHSMVIL